MSLVEVLQFHLEFDILKDNRLEKGDICMEEIVNHYGWLVEISTFSYGDLRKSNVLLVREYKRGQIVFWDMIRDFQRKLRVRVGRKEVARVLRTLFPFGRS